MHAEIDDLMHQARNSEEKAKKAMIDAARLADELRAEQDHTGNMEKAKRVLESQLGELDCRLAEASEAATKGGRSMIAELESLKLSWEPSRHGHQKPLKPSKNLSVLLRSSNFSKRKTVKIMTVSQN